MGGGSETQTIDSTTKIPKWLESVAKSNVNRADEASRIGYVPQYGPQVAAFSPQQEAAFANTNNMASAFGVQGGSGSYLPAPQTTAGGFSGYSTWDLAKANLDRLKQERPGQYDAIASMFIDPITGQGGRFAANPLAQPAQTSMPAAFIKSEYDRLMSSSADKRGDQMLTGDDRAYLDSLRGR